MAFPMRLGQCWLVVVLALALPAAAQEVDDELSRLLAELNRTKSLCAGEPDALTCKVADQRSIGIVANAVAEAGNSLDRATFIDVVRALLSDGAPEIRTSAVYALAKLGPDASDTPILRDLLADPISNVRAGAWSAAALSSDPAAKAMAARIPDRPPGDGYAPDLLAFDESALGFDLPSGADYLWLTASLREAGQLHFLTSALPDETLAHFVALAGSPARPLAEALTSDPGSATSLGLFLDPRVYGAPHVVTLPLATEGAPPRFAVVFSDRAFGQTGFAIVMSDGHSLKPSTYRPEETLEPQAPLDDASFDAAMLKRAGFKPDADPMESDLFMAVVAADGFGAEDYLEIYPDGAYVTEAKAYVAAPRLVLDALSYTETSDIAVSFLNISTGSSVSVEIQSVADEYSALKAAYFEDALAPGLIIPTNGRLRPGVYRVVAEVDQGDGSGDITVTRDFSVAQSVATLSLDKSEYAPGETITVTFTGMLGDDQDYVSTAEAGSGNGNYLKYVYTGSLRDGTVTLLAPTSPGSYEVRAFFREDESVLRGMAPFTVAGTVAVVTTPTPGTPTPPDPTAEARATLSLDKGEYAPGEMITVSFSGMSGDSKDYVSTAPAGSPNSTYLQYVYTQSSQAGSASLAAPTSPGSYEVRAFFREDETILRGAVPFVVTGTVVSPPAGPPSDTARATLTLDKATYAPGEPIVVSYADMFGDRQDYVATSPAGSPNTSYLQYIYTEGKLAGTATLTAPTTPGDYEVRAFFREEETILRASVVFSVK
jgi:hypothetical protein